VPRRRPVICILKSHFPQIGFPQIGFPQIGFPQIGFPQKCGFPQIGFPQLDRKPFSGGTVCWPKCCGPDEIFDRDSFSCQRSNDSAWILQRPKIAAQNGRYAILFILFCIILYLFNSYSENKHSSPDWEANKKPSFNIVSTPFPTRISMRAKTR
jgi:hypothetical protein